MNRRPFSYLVSLQFLGFRYHGWQKQPQVKTVHKMLDRTLRFVLGHDDFKTFGGSRTDAMVSSLGSSVQLFLESAIDENELLHGLNLHLPPDIRALAVKAVPRTFNILRDVLWKEYMYLFSDGGRHHPFCAPFMTFLPETLHLDAMHQGASRFLGTHNFRQYSKHVTPDTQVVREILLAEITENTFVTGPFFPEKSYCFTVRSRGFMRNQVRLMMGTLFAVGTGKWTLHDLEASLANPGDKPVPWLAPASGLILHRVEYNLPPGNPTN
jgi:tRNA pseudouridine38-40 synthase